MIASMLNVSQPVDISYNVGIMPHNHATRWRAGLKKEKATGAKEGGRTGKLEDNEKIKTSGFITLLGFGSIFLECLIILEYIHRFSFPTHFFSPFLFCATETKWAWRFL